MQQKKKSNIVVEVVVAANSEVEIAELYVHLVDDRQTAFFKEKRGYGFVRTEVGEVLLPRFKLNYSDTVEFGLKRSLLMKGVSYKGIVLPR